MCAFVSGLFAAVVISILTYTRVLTPACPSPLTPHPSHLISPLTPYPLSLTPHPRPTPLTFSFLDVLEAGLDPYWAMTGHQIQGLFRGSLGLVVGPSWGCSKRRWFRYPIWLKPIASFCAFPALARHNHPVVEMLSLPPPGLPTPVVDLDEFRTIHEVAIREFLSDKPPRCRTPGHADEECNEQVWQCRSLHRAAGVKAVKRSADYITATANSETSRPNTPDPMDRKLSKRVWERGVQQWRMDLKSVAKLVRAV